MAYLTVYFLEQYNVGHGARPGIGLEAEDGLVLCLALVNRRQLEKVARKDELDAAERPVVLPHSTRNRIHRVKVAPV